MSYKTITIKKRGGGTRRQRVQVLASGKYKFVKNNSKSKSIRKNNPHNKKKSNRRKNSMPRNKKKRRNGNHLTSTVMKFVRIGALTAPAISVAMDPTLSPKGKMDRIISRYTGYNIDKGTFTFSQLAKGWGPYLMAVLTTRGIQKISGILRRI